jgi:hypothetical protein
MLCLLWSQASGILALFIIDSLFPHTKLIFKWMYFGEV